VKYIFVEIIVKFIGDLRFLLVVVVLLFLFKNVLVSEQFIFFNFTAKEFG